MAGLMRPTEGKVLWKNEDIYLMSDDELTSWRGKNIGYLFQNYALLENETVRKNMLIAMKYGKYKNKGDSIMKKLKDKVCK